MMNPRETNKKNKRYTAQFYILTCSGLILFIISVANFIISGSILTNLKFVEQQQFKYVKGALLLKYVFLMETIVE